MVIFTGKNSIRLLSVVPLLFALAYPLSVGASEHEAACKDYIQNKIAWDYNSPYESAQKWESANLESLCKGTNNPKEPGECFQKVMTGHLKWGASDKWEWKNAVALCAGTDNSEERITCFKGRIEAGAKWDAAILECQSSGKIVIQ